MIILKRTSHEDTNFQVLVKELDLDLKTRDGEEHAFYSQFNKIDMLKHAVVAYENDLPVGCGAIKKNSPGVAEVKRMYVALHKRGQGIASLILKELETWCRELNYNKCILETGTKQPEAIILYKKNGYTIIPNFGQYLNVENSICFEKQLAG